MAGGVEQPGTPVTAEDLTYVHGDEQDEFLTKGKRDFGRFRFDDRLVDGFVYIANRPRWLITAVIGVIVGGGLIYAVLEGKGPIEGMWWAIVTGFTVGYGDQYPVTTAGRGLGAVLIVSMFILALCLGAQITSRLIEDQDEFTHQEQEQIKENLAHLVQENDRLISSIEELRGLLGDVASLKSPAADTSNDSSQQPKG